VTRAACGSSLRSSVELRTRLRLLHGFELVGDGEPLQLCAWPSAGVCLVTHRGGDFRAVRAV
jgi:hypothetical protein